MPALAVPNPTSRLARLALALVAALLILAALAAGQVPGEYPHLVLSDRLNDVPGSSGPWDNSHVFPAVSGASFDARISYEAVGQLNPNVFWALLVSVTPTPFPKTLIPPKLLTMPPFILLIPPNPMLNAEGDGQLTLFVPPGLFGVDAYIQGLVSDSTHVPAMQVSNGLQLAIEAPGMSVAFNFLRSQPLGLEGQLGDTGHISIGTTTLKTLKPLGSNPPPAPVDTDTPPPGMSVQVENLLGGAFTFQPILANTPDEPVNPLARPFTTITGSVTEFATTIPVEDTSFFPNRGRLLIAGGSDNLWANAQDLTDVPDVEVVHYDGKTRTSFLNCQRMQLGSESDESIDMPHVNGHVVAGEFTLATTVGARERTHVELDADNPDLPHVVIPDFSFVPGEGGDPETRSLDLYRYERALDEEQGFIVFDHRSLSWVQIPGTARSPSQGRWDPMICMAPDNKSFIAVLRISTGVWDWDSDPDQIWAVRLDGQSWPASGTQTSQISYELSPEPGPPQFGGDNVRSRRAVPRCFAIVGPDPDNYVLYAGLAHKWVQSPILPGSFGADNLGLEAEYIRQEVLVRDLIECPLVAPGSVKAPPTMPRPFIVSQFGNTGTGFPVVRFDPEMLVSPDHTRLFVVAGRSDIEEDAFVIRNVSVTTGGAVSKTLVNASGAAEPLEIRAMSLGGHGQGGKSAFSPNGTRIAYLVRHGSGNNHRKDWIDIALTSGGSFSQVKHVYTNTDGEFKEIGDYQADRVVSGLRFIDNNRLVFLMGRNPYDDPLALTSAVGAAMDWFSYNITTGVMTNLTQSHDPLPPPQVTTPFSTLGQLAPGGFFESPGGAYTYLLRFGGVSSVGGSSLPAGTAVTNLLGLNHATLGIFPVTGDEFGDAPVANLILPSTECRAPVETAAAMRFAEGSGVQEGMLYFAGHLVNGNGSDEIFAVNRDAPFVTLQATFTSLSGVHVRNLVPGPWSGKLAFSRSGTSGLGIANEHPFVVDLDNFLFERDILPTWTIGGSPIGRVMDGSFHYVAPSGSADEALVFAFGLGATPNGGVAQTAPPAYYPLANVSDPLAEPIPVVIPLIDTQLLGGDFRFYVFAAGPSGD